MAASVIVTSFNSATTLRQCLQSLTMQPCGEIIVADSSQEDPAPALRLEFPGVEFHRCPAGTTVPAMRWAALKRARFDVVLAVEARCVPDPGWVEAMEAAQVRHPASPAIGGSVAIGGNPSTFDWALYFCEYGQFAPPLDEAEAKDISGANLSYKRAALEREADLLNTGAWETLLHLRWKTQGLKLFTVSSPVSFHNSMTPGIALQQRFHYGRGYAGNRARRWAYLPFTPILPVLLLWRIARSARRSMYASYFPAVIPWTVLLTLAWSVGELVGYLAGPPRVNRNF